ncbi:MAG: SGNH/GDSL hydrolase family protein [Rubrimonas sp.]|uniref:SGNH/GDSL hydrolase family protein n=1 Tax=Rubrimonas sp. TaxID=2036015 RepID=UPI002FDD17C7
MKAISKTARSALIAVTFAAASPAAAQDAPPAPATVLFVGNSYSYYNDSLHNVVLRLAREAMGEAGKGYAYRSITISGGSLKHHPFAHYLEPANIGMKSVDLMILQGFSGAALDPERAEQFRTAVAEAVDLAEARGTRVALYMTHARGKNHKDYGPDQAGKIAALYRETAEAEGAILLPVGEAFEEARRRRPDLSLVEFFDNHHPSDEGTYLAAATIMATLYGKSPVGLEEDMHDQIDPETVAFLQQVAHDVVLGASGG